MNTLVAFFSASGNTKELASKIASIVNADLYEIKPTHSYTKKDLDWNDPNSRSSVEMNNLDFRPDLKDKDVKIANYSTIFIGFPIWWYIAPTIINTFLESHDFSNKVIIPFATSEGSGMGKTLLRLKSSCSAQTIFKEGKVLNYFDDNSIKAWIDVLDL